MADLEPSPSMARGTNWGLDQAVRPLSENLERVQHVDEIPEARIFHGRAGGGGSSALLIGYSDRVKRVTKVRGNPQGDIILVNELLTARLAVLVGAPCPEGRLVHVGPEILQTVRGEIPELARSTPGACFGRTYIEGSINPTEAICRDATNRSRLAGLVVLYVWTRNTDWKGEHLLWRVSGDSAPEVFGFDHGHCFDYQWDRSITQKANEVDLAARLSSAPQVVSVVSRADLDPFLDAMEALTQTEIDAVVDDVPAEWGVGSEELAALAEYLYASREPVARALRERFRA